MRIATTLGSEAIGLPVPPQLLTTHAQEAEQLGLDGVWSVHLSRGLDALAALAAASAVTSSIGLGVGVVPTYPRHPIALAQQAATVQALCGGRLTLGVGVSHRPVIEGMHGLSYDNPTDHLDEYLAVLVALLTEGSCHFVGDHFRVDSGLTVPGTSPVPVLVGALSPGMARTAGRQAHGVVTWLAGPRSLAAMIVPTVQDAAKEAGRGDPRIVAALPVAVWDDERGAREAADQAFARYMGLRNYQRLFEREGVSSVGALALVGSEATVERQVDDLAAVGVTELWAVPYPVGEDTAAAPRRTLALLGKLATSGTQRSSP